MNGTAGRSGQRSTAEVAAARHVAATRRDHPAARAHVSVLVAATKPARSGQATLTAELS